MHEIYKQFESNIALINEKVGRGTGIVALGAFKDAVNKAKLGFRVDVLNRPPKTAEFSLMNFYTLDVRLKEGQIIGPVQQSADKYAKGVLEAVSKQIGDAENLRRIKAFLKESIELEDVELTQRAKQSKKRKEYQKKYGLVTKDSGIEGDAGEVAESLDKFDMSICDILLEAEMLLTDGERVSLSDKVVADNNLKAGQKVTVKLSDGKTYKAQIMALPNDSWKTLAGKDFIVPKNQVVLSINNVQKNPMPIIAKNGDVIFQGINGGVDSTASDTSNIDKGDKFWWMDPTISLEEMGKDEELSDYIDALPAFIVNDGGKQTPAGGTQHAAIVNATDFVDLVTSALISAFRGKNKQGVTLEEILTGKFTQKVVNPEKGAFINKVKDPTSRQPLNFRAWDQRDLEVMHNIILYAFITRPNKSGGEVENKTPESKMIITEAGVKNAVFYMEEEEFDIFIKGGDKASELAKRAQKAVLNQIGGMASGPSGVKV